MHIVDITPKNNPEINDEDDLNRFKYFDKYYELHTKFLQPTNIKVDLELFNSEIKQYHDIFRQWGNNRPQNPRYGISLFNLDGNIRRFDSDANLTVGAGSTAGENENKMNDVI